MTSCTRALDFYVRPLCSAHRRRRARIVAVRWFIFPQLTRSILACRTLKLNEFVVTSSPGPLFFAGGPDDPKIAAFTDVAIYPQLVNAGLAHVSDLFAESSFAAMASEVLPKSGSSNLEVLPMSVRCNCYPPVVHNPVEVLKASLHSKLLACASEDSPNIVAASSVPLGCADLDVQCGPNRVGNEFPNGISVSDSARAARR